MKLFNKNVCLIDKSVMGQVQIAASPFQLRVIAGLVKINGQLEYLIRKLIELFDCLCGPIVGDPGDH
jgi:hypothetical protein